MASASPEFTVTPVRRALSRSSLRALHDEVAALRRRAVDLEHAHEEDLARIPATNRPSARNLLHYLALRQEDIRPLQSRLAQAGLSSLGRTEAHVLVSLDRVLGILDRALGRWPGEPAGPLPPVGFRHGEQILDRNAGRLLGPPDARRAVRIMVTLPSEAADEPDLVRGMIAAGMNCARINCAHDGPEAWQRMVRHIETECRYLGVPCRIFMDLAGPKLRTGPLRSGEAFARVHTGEDIVVVAPGAQVLRHEGSDAVVIECPVERIFEDVRPGHPIWFDDGKIGGEVAGVFAVGMTVRVTRAKPKGGKLRPEKGINLPATRLNMPAITAKDAEDLDFVVRHADAVSLSFVRDADDVLDLERRLDAAGADDLGVVLKIETVAAFENLPRVLFAALRRPQTGLMIARGDLAVEVGFERLAEIQEELLWLAEAVMLNKGPHILRAIATLSDILERMEAHQQKKRPLLRYLRISNAL